MAKDKEQILFELKIEENRALKKLKEVKESVKNLDRRTRKYKEAVKEQVALESKLTDVRKKRILVNKQMETSVKKLTKAQLQQKDATGSATSATMELSRIVSDAPYGIRGMANNLTQLVSQLGTASTKAGGFRNAIGLIIKQLTGPLGIVFAITAAISALDYFFGANKKTEDSVNDLSKAIGGTAGATTKLKTYAEIVRTSSEDTEEYKNALKNLKKEGYDPATQSLDDFIKKQLQLITVRAKAKVIENRLNELFTERVESETKLREKRLKIEELEIKKSKETNKVRRDRIQNNIDYVKSQMEAISSDEEYNKLQKELIELTKTQLSLEPTKTKGKSSDSSKKLSPFKTPKELEIDIKSAENAMIQMSKKIEQAKITEKMNEELAEAKTEEEKKKIREKYAVEKLKSQIDAERKMLNLKMATEKEMIKTKTKNHIDDLKRATDLYIHKIKLNENLTDKQKAQATRVAKSQFAIAKNQATGEEVEAFEELKEKYKPLFKLFEDLGMARMNALMSGFGLKKSGSEEEEFTFEQGLQKLMEVTSAATDFMNSEFDRQITIERNKTNALNNELNKRLLNENLSKEERKRIQLEIGANDEKLRKTQEKIEKKKFKLNKAANIAQATISAYLAGAQVLANEKLGAVGRIAAMTAVISSGLLQVAAIARTKFQSSAGSGGQIGGGFGGSDGGRDRSFNFNLAGASRENQLANTLQGRFDQPLQAYVVSRDITNSQQLDEDIRNNASFG